MFYLRIVSVIIICLSIGYHVGVYIHNSKLNKEKRQKKIMDTKDDIEKRFNKVLVFKYSVCHSHSKDIREQLPDITLDSRDEREIRDSILYINNKLRNLNYNDVDVDFLFDLIIKSKEALVIMELLDVIDHHIRDALELNISCIYAVIKKKVGE